MPQKSKAKTKYQNNPFYVASDGLTLLYDSARGVGILLLVLGLLSFFGNDHNDKNLWNNVVHTVAPWSLTDWILAFSAGAIIGLAFLMISALFGGVSAYTSYQLSKGEKVSLGEAFRVSFDNLWGFLWLQIIIFVKIVLWSLLLIIPGIIMAFRYSLASTAFFDEKKNLRGDAAIQESLRLTKGAWLTTYASNMLLNLLSLGAISAVLSTGVNAILYRQFDELGDKKKPEAHWLSWLTLALPFVLLVLAFMFIIALVAFLAVGGSLFL